MARRSETLVTKHKKHFYLSEQFRIGSTAGTPPNKSLQATTRHWLRVPGYPRSLRSLGALELSRYASLATICGA